MIDKRAKTTSHLSPFAFNDNHQVTLFKREISATDSFFSNQLEQKFKLAAGDFLAQHYPFSAAIAANKVILQLSFTQLVYSPYVRALIVKELKQHLSFIATAFDIGSIHLLQDILVLTTSHAGNAQKVVQFLKKQGLPMVLSIPQVHIEEILELERTVMLSLDHTQQHPNGASHKTLQ